MRNVVTPSEWTADFRTIDWVSTPGAPVRTRATFVIGTAAPERSRHSSVKPTGRGGAGQPTPGSSPEGQPDARCRPRACNPVSLGSPS